MYVPASTSEAKMSTTEHFNQTVLDEKLGQDGVHQEMLSASDLEVNRPPLTHYTAAEQKKIM